MKLFILPSLTSPNSKPHVHIDWLYRFMSENTQERKSLKKKDPDFWGNKVIYIEPAARVDGTDRNVFVSLNCHQGSK